MYYVIDCVCGKRIEVSSTAAGTFARCSCGERNEVPALSQLAQLPSVERHGEAEGTRVRKASVARILMHDCALRFFILFILPILLTSVVLGFAKFCLGYSTEFENLTKCGATAATLILFVLTPLMTRRLRSIKRLVETGTLVDGEVADIRLWCRIRRFEYVYAFEGREYRSGNTVLEWDRSEIRELFVNDPVQLVVAAERPNRALIASLYIADS